MNVVVFAGAGASKAVSPQDYPTTIEFFNQLPKEISTQPLFDQTLRFAKSHSEHQAIDIEVMLWYLGELNDFFKKVNDSSSLLGWFLSGSRLSAFLQKSLDLSNLKKLAAEGGPTLTALVNEIHRHVHDFYHRIPKKESLEACWLPLLNNLTEKGSSIEIFTTNYDVVIETVMDLLAASAPLKGGDPGWRGTIYRQLKIDLWPSRIPFTSPVGLLTKLHGSINWAKEKDNQIIYVSDPTFRGPDRHAIIYPGFKGKPMAEPFRVLHDYLSRCLLSAQVVIFLGFAFRDEYLNDVFARYLNPAAKVLIINPSDIKELPFHFDRIAKLKRGFSTESVAWAINQLEAGTGDA